MASALFGGVLAIVAALSVALGWRTRFLRSLIDRYPAADEITVLLVALLVFDIVCTGLLARFGAALP